MVLPGVRHHIREILQVVLLLKRDGPCDIHLIHDNLIKQPLFRPRKRELTSRKKVLPTLALSAIDTHTHTQAHTLDRQDPEAGNTQVLSSTCAVGWASSLTLAVQLSHPPGRGLTGKRRLTDDRFYLFFKRREREPLRGQPLFPYSRLTPVPHPPVSFPKSPRCHPTDGLGAGG